MIIIVICCLLIAPVLQGMPIPSYDLKKDEEISVSSGKDKSSPFTVPACIAMVILGVYFGLADDETENNGLGALLILTGGFFIAACDAWGAK